MTFFINTHARTELADVTDRIFWLRVHVKRARTMHVVPLGFIFAVAIENLDAMVLPVGDVDPAIFVCADVVDDIELAWITTGLAPREQEFSVRRVFVHPGIAVTVGDVNLSLRRKGDMGAAVERLAALVGCELSRNAEGQKNFAIEGALAHRVIAIIRQIDRLIRPHGCAVSPLERSLAPGAEKVAVAVED